MFLCYYFSSGCMNQACGVLRATQESKFVFHKSSAGIITSFEIHISSSKLVTIQVNSFIYIFFWNEYLYSAL